MSREVLLAAIRANPAEDLPRLLYADWLAEHGAGDLDAATVEFVRVSCDCRAGGRPKGPSMPLRAYRWLPANWYRLLPSVVALHTRAARANGSWPDLTAVLIPELFFKGRQARGSVWVREDNGKRYAVAVEFDRGFVSLFSAWSVVAKPVLGPLVTADQPLAKLNWEG